MNLKRVFLFVPMVIWLSCFAVSATAKPTQKTLDSALFSAIDNNDLKRAQSLLQRGANVNARDEDGYTALIIVSFVGDPQDEVMRVHPIEFLQLFLKRGANVNLAGADGETALMTAAQGSPQAVRLLLAKGARINAQTKAGETALMRAVMWECEGPCNDPETVQMLLARGANSNLATTNGETALMQAAQLSFYNQEDALRNAKMLLARGADVRARTRNGNTALKWAKASGNPAFVRLIQNALAQR